MLEAKATAAPNENLAECVKRLERARGARPSLDAMIGRIREDETAAKAKAARLKEAEARQ